MMTPFYLHFLKEDFIPLVYKYKIEAKLIEGSNRYDESDGLLTFYLNFDAPGEIFGVETDDVIRHYWELVNFFDEQNSGFEPISFDLENGEIKPADKSYFVFGWCGEFKTQTTLIVDYKTFLEYIRLLIKTNPNNTIFNFDTLKRTRVINQFIQKSF